MTLLIRAVLAALAVLVAVPADAGPIGGRRAAVLVQKTAFNPSRSGLQVWADFSDLSTITQAGGVISQINDKSGHGNHLVQATGSAQPAVIAAGRNGRSIARFDGSNDRLATAGALSGSGATFIFIGKSTKTASGVRVIAGTANGDPVANGGFQMTHEDRGGANGTDTLAQTFRTGSSGAFTDKYTYYGKNGSYPSASWAMVTAGYSLNDKSLYYNAVDQGPYDLYQSSAGVNAYVASGLVFTFGADASGGAAGALDVGDVLVYSRRLTTAEVARLWKGAARKWALP